MDFISYLHALRARRVQNLPHACRAGTEKKATRTHAFVNEIWPPGDTEMWPPLGLMNVSPGVFT